MSVPVQSGFTVAVPVKVSSAMSPFKLRVWVPVMFPDVSWVNMPVAATGPIAGMDPVVLKIPTFPRWRLLYRQHGRRR